MLVCISNPPVVLFLVFILRRIGIGVSPLPELLDEVISLFIVGKALEGLQLLVGDDPAHLFVDPPFVGSLQLVSKFLLLLELFLVTLRPAQRILVARGLLGC